jgi:hypothetical protein
MLPTNFVCTIATIENIKFDAMEGTANCHMVGRVYSGASDSSAILIVVGSNLQDSRLSNPQRQ